MKSSMRSQSQKIALFIIGLFSGCVLLLQHQAFFKPRIDPNYLRTRNHSVTSLLKFTEILQSITFNFTPNESSFFLVESSGRSTLTIRELCTIESVATHHPEHSVYVLLTTNLLRKTWPTRKLIEIYPNVQFRFLEFESFIKASPLRHLWNSGQIQKSLYLVSHVSDIVRFLILYKFGGYYLDLDQLLLRPLPDLPNFIGKESSFVGAGVLRFRAKHQILDKFIQRLRTSFRGEKWGANGPMMATSVLQAHCSSLKNNQCGDISILPKSAFYPIHWKKWHRYFDSEETETVLEEISNNTYSIHLWGKMSGERPLGGYNAYTTLAEKHCPVTFAQVNIQSNLPSWHQVVFSTFGF